MTTTTDTTVDLGIEEVKTVSFKVNAQGMTATREFRLSDAADFTTFIEALFGTFFATTGDIIPGTLGYYPGIPRLVVDEVDVSPWDDNVGSGTRLNGVADPLGGQRVRVRYKTHEWDLPSGQGLQNPNTDMPGGAGGTHPATLIPILATHRVSVGGEMIEIPKSSLVWQTAIDNSTKIKAGERRAAQFVGSVSHVITWHRCPSPPWTAIRIMRGRVNTSTFLGHQPETVLFTGLTGQRQYQVNGDRSWSLTFTFLARDQLVFDPNGTVTNSSGGTFTWLTWNHFPRQITDGSTQSLWQRLVRKGTADKYVYGTGNFNTLFLPEEDSTALLASSVGNN